MQHTEARIYSDTLSPLCLAPTPSWRASGHPRRVAVLVGGAADIGVDAGGVAVGVGRIRGVVGPERLAVRGVLVGRVARLERVARLDGRCRRPAHITRRPYGLLEEGRLRLTVGRRLSLESFEAVAAAATGGITDLLSRNLAQEQAEVEDLSSRRVFVVDAADGDVLRVDADKAYSGDLREGVEDVECRAL